VNIRRVWALVLAAGMAGCGREGPLSQPSPPSATNAPPATVHLDHALPRLPTLKLWLGNQEITAEVALTLTEIATGMMFRTNLADNEGMLFVFNVPHRAAFYMKNTYLPLSAAYIDPEGIILEIHDLQPLDETPVEARSDQVQYVLEMRQGWFDRHGIGPGALVRTELGSLREVFGRRR
jgi:uncharacterized membrane protein (UPF0127 family)/predicted small lipoprotein YifL